MFYTLQGTLNTPPPLFDSSIWKFIIQKLTGNAKEYTRGRINKSPDIVIL